MFKYKVSGYLWKVNLGATSYDLYIDKHAYNKKEDYINNIICFNLTHFNLEKFSTTDKCTVYFRCNRHDLLEMYNDSEVISIYKDHYIIDKIVLDT